MFKHVANEERLKRASDGGLLDKGQELLAPTITITSHIKNLSHNPKYQPFEKDLDNIIVATERLSDLIKECFAINHAQAQLQKQEIHSTIQHDLSTPLIAITGYSELIQEELEAENDTDACETLEHVLQLSQKLLNLIKDLDYMAEISAVRESGNAATTTLIMHDRRQAESETKIAVTTPLHAMMPAFKKQHEHQEEATLLVVDDKESNRDFLSRRLEKQGFFVDVAENGQMAINMLKTKHYDLILLDIIMPKLNGYEVLAKLKKNEKLKHIPVIMISALDEIDSVVQCLEMGAEDYLQKPFKQIILTTKITACLERNWLRAREQAHNEKLEQEQKKTEALLLNILPASIAERLKNGESPIADSFDDVTVLFADIVHFADMSAHMSPEKLVEKLNTIFLTFDMLAELHGLEKIKTIGDAYLLVGGMPVPSADHVKAVAEMALDMQESIHHMNAVDGGNVSMRIGIHTGPVVAAVIGKHKFSYDLWGDAVVIASRMESHGVPDKIQISDATFQRIKHDFPFEARGSIKIKGKGKMPTYFLKDRRGH